MLGVLSFGLHGGSQQRNVALRSCCFLLMVAAPVVGLASVERPSFQGLARPSISGHERQVWTSAVHDSEFAGVEHHAARPGCEATQPPQALATPDPLVDEPEPNAKVTVSFIVGIDGRETKPYWTRCVAGGIAPQPATEFLPTLRRRSSFPAAKKFFD